MFRGVLCIDMITIGEGGTINQIIAHYTNAHVTIVTPISSSEQKARAILKILSVTTIIHKHSRDQPQVFLPSTTEQDRHAFYDYDDLHLLCETER